MIVLRAWFFIILSLLPLLPLLLPGVRAAREPALPTVVRTVCPVGCAYASIQAAINASAAGDLVDVLAGVYVENVMLKAGVSVQGADPATTIIDGNQADHVITSLDAALGPDTVVSGFTVRNGRSVEGGGVELYRASPTLRNLIIEDNFAGNNFGGGIAVISGAKPIVENCIIRHNTALRGGGIGVYDANSSITLRNTTIISNTASESGGGLFLFQLATATLSQVVIEGNRATRRGGGATVANQSTMWLDQVTVRGNESVTGSAGGIAVDLASQVTLERTTVISNTALLDGAGIQVDRSTLVVRN
ncbi:MAG: right-handed parallel beta-helix repeat-containing protein, partial [Anaerolineae bacterium]